MIVALRFVRFAIIVFEYTHFMTYILSRVRLTESKWWFELDLINLTAKAWMRKTDDGIIYR